MNLLLNAIKVVVGGVVGSLGVSLVFWLLTASKLFAMFGIQMGTPADLLPWIIRRAVEGGIFGLLFLVPVMKNSYQWQRGLLFGLAPALKLWFWDYVRAGLGPFGIGLGLAVPILALFFSLLWGLLSGVVLDRTGYVTGDPELEEE